MLCEKELVDKIEQLRVELLRQAAEYGMKSPEVLAASQRLDEVLNQYYDLSYMPRKDLSDHDSNKKKSARLFSR